MSYDLAIPSTIAGLISAGLWFYSAKGITRAAMLRQRTRRAEREGVTPDLSGLSIGDLDLRRDDATSDPDELNRSGFVGGSNS